MGGADRISALPEEIKISILSRLNVKYAIRTSALARSWRHLWTHLPCLRLGIGCDRDLLDYDNDSGDLRVTSDWIERVSNLISSLRGPLVVFKLSHLFRTRQSPLVQNLLHLLLQKGGVETLHLSSCFEKVHVHLPPFHSLKVLRLFGCHVLLPAGFRGFNSLTNLCLDHVEISNDHLHFLIHTSNNLTTFMALYFVTAQVPLSVNISSPLLRHLNFQIDDSVDKVSVISAPCLEQVEISTSNHTDSSSKKFAPVALGLLISISMVSSLNLYSPILKCLSLVTLPFNFTFPRLRSLTFCFFIDTMVKTMYDAFFRLLRSMPFVEELKLLCPYSNQNNCVEILKQELLEKKREGISCLNQTLEIVTINMKNVMIGVILGNFFLLNARVLKLMKFECSTWSVIKPSMIKELQKAEVTSSAAKVVIFCHKENVSINIK
ncbi:hypothetical protein LUZ61_017135 [Rhynchospora tenuis]|uniref:F-box domain-containing protein n=1 Tax=Rhynchospora tenuis TaxID=198213 RepID=A0AAD5Z6Z7_9POAL|nr:hypothetical protein LUZ61_017135 [Rhynchospora tenuis]